MKVNTGYLNGTEQSGEFSVTVEDGAAKVVQGEAQQTVRFESTRERLSLLDESGKRFPVSVTKVAKGAWITVGGVTFFLPILDRKPRGKSANAGNHPVSPMPGVVVRVAVEEGQRVEQGDVLAVVEAMKMEHSVKALSLIHI